MSLVTDALAEVERNKSAAAARARAAAEATAASRAEFIKAATDRLQPIVDTVLKPAAADLVANGYAAQAGFMKFDTHVVAGLDFCPRQGDKPKSFHDAECTFGQATNAVAFQLYVSGDTVSITGTTRDSNPSGKWLDEKVAVKDLSVDTVAQKLRGFIVAALSPNK